MHDNFHAEEINTGGYYARNNHCVV